MRVAVFLIVWLVALAALAASDRAKPLVAVYSHPADRWLFNQADYQRCVTVRLPPIKNPISTRGVAVVQPTA